MQLQLLHCTPRDLEPERKASPWNLPKLRHDEVFAAVKPNPTSLWPAWHLLLIPLRISHEGLLDERCWMSAAG